MRNECNNEVRSKAKAKQASQLKSVVGSNATQGNSSSFLCLALSFYLATKLLRHVVGEGLGIKLYVGSLLHNTLYAQDRNLSVGEAIDFLRSKRPQIRIIKFQRQRVTEFLELSKTKSE